MCAYVSVYVCVCVCVEMETPKYHDDRFFLSFITGPRSDYAEATPPEAAADICQMSQLF